MKKDLTITTSTRICAVIGNPVAHSMSPAIHNAAFDELGLDMLYVAFGVEDLQSALTGMRALKNFRGMSITIPHKIEAMKYVDEIADVDLAIGSINTVINENGRLSGFGTDGPGALQALVSAGVTVTGSDVLMLGAGGAARAIAFTLALNASPSKITLLDLNGPLLEGLSADLASGTSTDIHSAAMDSQSLGEAMSHADIIINCTPVGMHPREGVSLVPPELFRSGQVVFDVVYTPLETKLIADAKARGLLTVSGVEMFVNQAVMQFERFTGEKAPVELMRRVVMERLSS